MKRLTSLLFSLLCLGLLASSAYAFPDNGVLDTFTGTDTTSPPNANWTNAEVSGGSGCDLEDNAAAPSTTTNRFGCYWNPGTFNADQEVYATVVNTGSTSEIFVCGRLVNIGSTTTDGYCLLATDGTSLLRLQRIDNEVLTAIGTGVSQAITTTDKIGLKMVGNQICAWFSDDGGAWAELECATDATYSAGGNIGLIMNGAGSVGAADDFGGGNVAGGAAGVVLQQSFSPIGVLQ